MATTISTQDIVDAKRDIEDIGKAVNENVIVSPRYGEDFKSLPMISAEGQAAISTFESNGQSSINSFDATAQNTINDWQDAINTITVNDGVPALAVSSASGENQQDINDYNGAKWRNKAGGYDLNARVMLDNGDIVRSTVAENTVDPNTDMTGWELADAALNSRKLKRENVSVWDFFTSAQLIEYKASPINYDAQPNLQQFFDYISQNDVGVAYCSGEFYVTSNLILGGSTNSGTKTKKIIGNLKLQAKNAIEEMLTVQTLSDFSWTGWVEVVGIGSVAYSTRTCRTGVKIGDAYTASRCKFEKIIARSFYEFGVACPKLTTLTNVGEVRCYDCGSGKNTANYSLTSAFSNPVNTGVAANLNQYTTIDVDELPPENLYTNLKVMIGTDYYYVNSIDRVNKKLNVFPWVSSTNTETTLRYVFGGAVLVQGSDSSVLNIDYIDATRCSQILVSTALYAPVVNKIVGQYCGVAISLGLSLSSACVGGACYGLYNEAGDCDFMRVTRANINYTLVGFVASADKFRNISAPRSNDNDISILYDNFEGLTYINGGVYTFNARTNHSAATIALDLTKPSARDVFGYGDNKEIILYASQAKVLKQWGYQHKRAVVIGNGLNYRPTGIVKFTAPSGYTVNGQSQVEFSKFNSIAGFDVYLQYNTTNFVVSRQDGALVQVTYDPDPIAANSAIITTVTMTGAVVGDLVQASFSINNANLRLYAFVSSANTVTVEFRNIAASQIDLTSGTLTVKLV